MKIQMSTTVSLRTFLLCLVFSTVFLSCIIFSCASSVDIDTSSVSDDDESSVFTLTDGNFDEITGDGSWLLEFYAPWCGHCKKLAPVYEEAAKRLSKEGSPFRLAKIDATVEKELASRFGIRSFPTLKFKRGEELRSFNGARTVEALLSYAHEMSGPPVQSVTSAKTLKTVTSKNPLSFLLFSSSAKSDIALKSFTEVAFRLQGIVKFLHVSTDTTVGEDERNFASNLLKEHNLRSKDAPCVVVISAGEETEPFTGPFDDPELLKEFVWNNRMPLVSDLDGSNFEELTGQGKLLMLLIVDPKSIQQSAAYKEAAIPVAKKYKGKYIFATIDGNKFTQYVAQFSVDASKDLPTVVALDYPEYYYSPKQLFPLSGSLPAHQIDDFVDAVADGKISSSGTIPWYNPQRYFKKLERFLNSLSTTSFVLTVIGMTIVFVGVVFYCCKCLIGFDDGETKEEEEGEGEGEDGDGQTEEEKKKKEK